MFGRRATSVAALSVAFVLLCATAAVGAVPAAAAPQVTPIVDTANGQRTTVAIRDAHSELLSFDGETRNRTADTTIFSRVLYQLSYLAMAGRC